MLQIHVSIKNKSKHEFPKYETLGSSGMDIRADIDTPIVLSPGDSTIIPTGLYMEIPTGYELQIRPRSGLAAKHGITVLNSPGTIDSDYRNEIGIILINHGRSLFTINSGDRICQGVFAEVTHAVLIETKEVTSTDRSGGFGHTGIK